MLKKLVFLSLLLFSSLQGEVIEITQIDDVRPFIQSNALCLFDIDDTLIDNPFLLGAPVWRNWVKPKLADKTASFALFDALTLYIAQKAPYKAVEHATAKLIDDLQQKGIAVFAFTARGRSQWYTTDIEGVDRFTHAQLKQAQIDFQKTQIPAELQNLEPNHFHNGVIFAQHIKKGDLLKHLLKDLNYKPSLILFVDDRLDQVKSVEAAVQESGTPFAGFWYRRSEVDRAHFTPAVANIQLEQLLINGQVVSDEDAAELAKSLPVIDPKDHLDAILKQMDLEQKLKPSLP